MNAAAKSYITFPPGAVSGTPLRMPMLWNSDNAIALSKPPGVAAFPDSRVGGGANSIVNSINSRAAEGSAFFERLGIDSILPVNLLDREASGITVYAKSKEARARFKNAMGSSMFRFRYRFLTLASVCAEELSCDLPLAVHKDKSIALVSHRTGKKTFTLFRRIEQFEGCSLWESESVFDRFHQVRLHASEAGLPVIGDEIYRNSRKAAAAADGPVPGLLRGLLALHLFSIRFPEDEATVELEANYPRRLQIPLNKLSRDVRRCL